MDIAFCWREEQGWIVLESEVGHGDARYVATITAVVCAAHTGKAPPLWLNGSANKPPCPVATGSRDRFDLNHPEPGARAQRDVHGARARLSVDRFFEFARSDWTSPCRSLFLSCSAGSPCSRRKKRDFFFLVSGPTFPYKGGLSHRPLGFFGGKFVQQQRGNI